jgi:predicted RNase H-like HicB family nuclease
MKASYTAHCVRSGGWWSVDVPELPGVFTQARNLREAERMAREAIALLLDVEVTTVAVEIDVDLGDEVSREVAELEAAKTAARLAQESAAEAARRVAADLTRRHGLTMRDAGTVLGLSHQRVSQLLHGLDAS